MAGAVRSPAKLGSVARPSAVEQRIATLSGLRDDPEAPATLAALLKAFGDRSNLVVAKAAAVAGELGLRECRQALTEAFDRFLFVPARGDKDINDPQCWAKAAIVKALMELDHDDPAVFLHGLRLKVVSGDASPEVIGQCFVELLGHDAPRHLDLVARHLRDDEVRFEAVCALSECRDVIGATALLEACQQEVRGDVREEMLLALGRSRHPVGVEYLLDRVANGSSDDAVASLEGIAHGPHRRSLADRVASAASQRRDPRVERAYADLFGND